MYPRPILMLTELPEVITTLKIPVRPLYEKVLMVS